MAKRKTVTEIRKQIAELDEALGQLETQQIALLNYRQALLDVLGEVDAQAAEAAPENAVVEAQPEAAAPEDMPLHKVQLGDGIPLPIIDTDDIPELDDEADIPEFEPEDT